jgi:hypothetical protein
MSQTITIALDAMGGDSGPEVVIGGAELRSTAVRICGSWCSERSRSSARCWSAIGGFAMPRHSIIAKSRCRWTTSRASAPEGTLEVVHVAVRSGGAGRRGWSGRVGRQHRRADGDGEVLPEASARHRAARHRGDVADTETGESIVLDVGATIGADPACWSISP